MSDPEPIFANTNPQLTHAEANRLTRRLFQLEARVSILESRVEEISEMLNFLMAQEFLENENDFNVEFCTCDDDESDY